ncbi:hypothetical protein PENTCL1PPCAC_8802, partial [Pristionchus entomophagus]
KLIYFDLRGRAESIRQVFAHAGVAFDDVRISRAEWLALKPHTPYGQLPVLEVDGRPIGQSSAILRFLGKQFNLTGRTLLEEARVEMIGDLINEFYEEIKPYVAVVMGFAQGDKDHLYSSVFLPNRDKYLALLARNITGDFILDHVTWADIHLANSLEFLLSIVPSALDNFPMLKARVHHVHSTPRMKAYLHLREKKEQMIEEAKRQEEQRLRRAEEEKRELEMRMIREEEEARRRILVETAALHQEMGACELASNGVRSGHSTLSRNTGKPRGDTVSRQGTLSRRQTGVSGVSGAPTPARRRFEKEAVSRDGTLSRRPTGQSSVSGVTSQSTVVSRVETTVENQSLNQSRRSSRAAPQQEIHTHEVHSSNHVGKRLKGPALAATMVHYKLTYFDLRGRAESIRQVFAYAGVAFDDVRIPRGKWPELKPHTPFGQLPVLEVDGAPIAQSAAILRFLGKQFELTGKTPLEEAKLDMVVDQIADFTADIKAYMMVALGFVEGDKEALYSEVFLPNRDKHLALLAKQITGDYILGHITWADIHLANSLEGLLAKLPDFLDGHPHLKAYVHRIHAHPRLKAHLATRPDAPF